VKERSRKDRQSLSWSEYSERLTAAYSARIQGRKSSAQAAKELAKQQAGLVGVFWRHGLSTCCSQHATPPRRPRVAEFVTSVLEVDGWLNVLETVE
jgi:hypothetical protein